MVPAWRLAISREHKIAGMPDAKDAGIVMGRLRRHAIGQQGEKNLKNSFLNFLLNVHLPEV
jgi:hypothetical protein